MIKFIIEGEPHGKGRPRFGNGRTYTPKKTMEYEKLVAFSAHKASLKKTSSAISVEIMAIHKRPKRLMRKSDPKGRIIKDTKPDIDNIVKAVLDGLKSFFDDKQVYYLVASKYWSAIEEEAKVEVVIKVSQD